MSSRWSVKMIQVLKGFMTTEVSVMSFVVTFFCCSSGWEHWGINIRSNNPMCHRSLATGVVFVLLPKHKRQQSINN